MRHTTVLTSLVPALLLPLYLGLASTTSASPADGNALPATPHVRVDVRPFQVDPPDADHKWLAATIELMVQKNLREIDGVDPLLAATWRGNSRTMAADATLTGKLRVTGTDAGAGQVRAQLTVRHGNVVTELSADADASELPALAGKLSGRIAMTLGISVDDSARARFASGMSDDPAALEALARGLSDARQYARIEAFERATALAPEFAEALLHLGESYAAQRDADKALVAYGRAVAARPDFADAHRAVADILLQRGELERAQSHAESAVSSRPRQAANHVALGEVLRERGDLSRAAAAFREALALQPGQVEALAALSLVEWQLSSVGAADADAARASRRPSKAPADSPSADAITPTATRIARARPPQAKPESESADRARSVRSTAPTAKPSSSATLDAQARAEIGVALERAQQVLDLSDRDNKDEGVRVLGDAKAALDRGDGVGAYELIARFYDDEGLLYAARKARQSGRKLMTGGTPSTSKPAKIAKRATTPAAPTPVAKPEPPAVAQREPQIAKREPAPAAAAAPSNDGKARDAAARELAFAEKLLARSLVDPKTGRQMVTDASKALEAGDVAGMYRALAKFYDSEGLRYKAKAARETAERSPTARVASSSASSTSAGTATARPSTRPTPRPESVESRTVATRTAGKTAPPAPSSTAIDPQAARDLGLARKALETSSGGGASAKLIAEAQAELSAGNVRAMYNALARFYDAEGLSYAARSARQSARRAAEGGAVAQVATAAPERTRSESKRTAPKVEKAATMNDTTAVVYTAKERVDAVEELRFAELLLERSTKRGGERAITQGKRAYEAGDIAGMYKLLAEFYGDQGLRQAADTARRTAASLGSRRAAATPTTSVARVQPTPTPTNVTKPAANKPATKKPAANKPAANKPAANKPAVATPAAKPTTVARATPKKPAAVEPKPKPKPTKPAAPAVKRPMAAIPSDADPRDQRELASAQRLLKDTDDASDDDRAYLEAATVALGRGDRAEMYRALAALYDNQGLSYAARGARKAAKKAGATSVEPPTIEPRTAVADAAPAPTAAGVVRDGGDVAERADRAARELAWARQTLVRSGKANAGTEASLARARAALDGGDVVGMYEALAELYDTQGLRYSADSARLAAQAAGGTAARVASASPVPTTPPPDADATRKPPAATRPVDRTPPVVTPVPKRRTGGQPPVLSREPPVPSGTPSRRAARRPVAQPTRSAERAPVEVITPQPRTTPAPSTSPVRRKTSKSPAVAPPTQPVVVATELPVEDARELREAMAVRERTGSDEVSNRLLEDAKSAMRSGERARMYLSLARFYEHAGLQYSAGRAERTARALGGEEPTSSEDGRRIATVRRADESTRPIDPIRPSAKRPRAGERGARRPRPRGTPRPMPVPTPAADRSATTMPATKPMRQPVDLLSQPATKPVQIAANTEPATMPATAPAAATPRAKPGRNATTVKRSVRFPIDEQSRLRNSLKSVVASLQGWRSAWASKDLATYLNAYAPSFRSGARDLEDWRTYKAEVFAKPGPVSVALRNVGVALSPEQATVRFDQLYASDHLKDHGTKTLVLSERDGRYLIAKEDWKALAASAPDNPGVDNLSELDEALEAALAAVAEWHAAWERRDLEAYMSHYAPSFKSGNRDRAAWKDHKAGIFSSAGTIEVDLRDLRVKLESDRVIVEFTQVYRSSTHEDRGHKTLVLTPGPDGYQIASEDWIN